MIVDRIYSWAHLQPTKTALIHNGVRISYAAFARAIEASRLYFAQQNLPPGELAIVLAASFVDGWVFVLALRALGLDTVCLASPSLAEDLKFKNIACVVVSAAERSSFRLEEHSPGGARIVTVPKAIYRNVQRGELPKFPHNAPVAGGHILLTSGTTGTYKKVPQPGASDDKRNEVRAAQLRFDKDTVAHMLELPLLSGAGFKQPSAVWHVGGCAVIDQRRDRLKQFFESGPTHAFVVPATLKRIVDEADTLPGRAPGRIEFAAMGGFIPLKTAEQVVGELNAKLSLQYSATETGGLIMATDFGNPEDLTWYKPVSGRTLKIVNAQGDECATGEEGKLGIQLSDIDCGAYLDDDDPSAKIFDNGFFYPGDLAVRRADGRIRILGRVDDVVNIQGRKKASGPIEQSIQDFLRVDEVCVFSGRSAGGDDEVVVAMQAERTISQSALDTVTDKFGFGQVRYVVLKEFPRAGSAMNKVQRSRLRKILFDGA